MSGIDRINALFETGQAFVGYLTAGDGGINQTLAATLALIQGGVNMLEIGVPFSDPIADGPVIQRASERALKQGTTLADIFKLAKQIRAKSDIPMILFSYINPLLAMGAANVVREASEAGIDGLLLVDCPPEAADIFYEPLLAAGLAPIFIATPTTPDARLQYLSKLGRGFLYYACRKGTTGMKSDLPEDFPIQIKRVKQHSHLPVVVGFGISKKATAKEVLMHADGVVVGSLFVKALEDDNDSESLCQLTQKINPFTVGA